MKWIGQHIWDFISRFRSKVYFEDVDNAGSDTDAFLVKKADGEVAIRTGAEVLSDIGASSESTDLEFSGDTANGVLTYGGAAQIDVESTLTYNGGNLKVTSSDTGPDKPIIELENSNADALGPTLRFTKTETGADNDILGTIDFKGDNANNEQYSFASIVALIDDSVDGVEAGGLSLNVAEYDGTLTSGIRLTGNTDANGEVDVSIGMGAASTTTIAGDLTVTSGITIGGHKFDDIDIGSEFTDTDDHIMSSGAIKEKIENYGYTTSDLHGAGVDGAAYNLLSDAGDGSITSNSTFRYNTALGIQKLELGGSDGIPFTIHTADHDNGAGADLTIEAGDAANGGSTDSAGGDLIFRSGQPTGSGAFGNFLFHAGYTQGTGTDVRSNSKIAQLEGNAATSTDFTLYEKAGSSVDDFFKIAVANHGATAITTTDDSGVNGNLSLTPDGQLNLGSSISKINTTFDFHANTFETIYSSGHYSGKVIRYSPAGDLTATAGAVYYLRTTGAWNLADADSASTSAVLLGVGLSGSIQTFGLLLSGFIRVPYTEILNVPGSGAVDGAPVYLGTEAGHFDFTAPSGSGDIVRILGYAIDDYDDSGNTDVLIYFDPDKTWIEIA